MANKRNGFLRIYKGLFPQESKRKEWLYNGLRLPHRFQQQISNSESVQKISDRLLLFRVRRHLLEKTNTPSSQNPKVSIIIPVHNHRKKTLKCLLSILTLTDRVSYEIIIADDASEDFSPSAFSELKSIKHVRHQTPIGFFKNCNAASKQARGDYLVILNNDTKVLPGWLDFLVDTLTRFPEAGLAGSKIISSHGDLKEAGCFVWADGSITHYGRGEDPEHYRYNYVQEVDFVSSTSFMIPRNLWKKLEGFDEGLASSGYEDTDLAFRVRAAGYKVLYQPFSQAIHFENENKGENFDKKAEGVQRIGKQNFIKKWHNVLASHPLPEQALTHTLSARNAKGQVLYIDDSTPRTDHYAGSVQAVFLLNTALRDEGYAVSFLPLLEMRYL
jgi:GT2 family glycosyltransferase